MEKIYGDHCVKLHGRTYHFFTNTAGQNGLSYFTFDAAMEVESHGNSLNSEVIKNNKLRIVNEFLIGIYEELKSINILVQELENIGIISRTNSEIFTIPNVITEINTKTSYFDVAGITNDDTI